MNPNSGSNSDPTSSDPSNFTTSQDADLDTLATENWGPEQENNDPVWNLLGEASKQEPSAFFARNVVRDARLLENTTAPSWGARLASFFSPTKLTIGAAACACALAVYQMWPAPNTVTEPGITITTPPIEPSSALTELVIEASLEVAAEDPTLFTRDEVVAMIGF